MDDNHNSVTEVGLGLVIRQRGPRRQLLVSRRPEATVYAGYWEFPGGKIDPGETPEQAVVRELREELAIGVRPVRPLPVVEHIYDHAHVRLHGFVCEHQTGEPINQQVAAHRWVSMSELTTLHFPEANAEILAHLRTALAEGKPQRQPDQG